MKHLLIGVALATLVGSALAADVGVSVSIGQPGFYGRIDIGNFPQPQLIYAQPLIIQPALFGYARQPIYLRVPPGHAKHWDKNCDKYNACGQPVYFVQDNWYRNEYAPAYQGNRNDDRGNNGKGKGKGKGHDKESKNKGHGHD
jgi:hypothetical protein